MAGHPWRCVQKAVSDAVLRWGVETCAVCEDTRPRVDDLGTRLRQGYLSSYCTNLVQ
jgi:hypothetical protein